MQETNTLTTGIKTRQTLDENPYGYVVEWIDWESDFRNSDLQHADIIIGVNDKKYLKENSVTDHPKAIGNYLESTYWAELQSKVGDRITLHVFREGQLLSIQGKLGQPELYLNKENARTIGLNGPVRLNKDGFSSPWGNWYENFVRHVSLYLDDKRWERITLDNIKILKEHLEWKERVDYLVKHYPGRFAEQTLCDWETVRKILEGITYSDITDEKLEYRKIGEQRKLLIKEAAIKGRETFLDKLSAELIPAFPAMDPVHGNISTVVGKKTALPVISYEQFINDLGKSYAVIGSAKNGFYFIHLNSKEMDVFFKTLFHYQAQVIPDVAERYQFMVEILNEPAMLTYEGKPVNGLMVKVIAGMAGEDDVFIDTRKVDQSGKAAFEGEEALSMFAGYPLEDGASPEQVIEAMIGYIKLGDQKSWKKLFCNWQVYIDWEGPPYIDLAYWFTEENYQHTWEKSRRQILADIYDARVLYTSPVITKLEANKETGIPKVEQVKIIIDHVGKIDGVYRSLSNLYVHRKWRLQRLNGGPWRITELQAL